MKYLDKSKKELIDELQKSNQEYNLLKALYDKDIDNYKQIEMELTIANNEIASQYKHIKYLASITEFSEDAIISKTLEGTIKTWNKAAERMFGYTAEQAIGENISLIIPPDKINEEKSVLAKICNNEITEHYETSRTKKSGEQFYVSLTASPLKDEKGTIIGVSNTNRDITTQKMDKLELIRKSDELLLANKELAFQSEDKEKRATELNIANAELAFQSKEKEKRAAELIIANNELAFQNREKEKRADELIIANKELAFQNNEKEKRAAELIIANKELTFQNKEKEKRAAELVVANEKLAIENKEKEKKAGELIIANKELALQNREKEKRADELALAIKELAYQSEEKEKRANELIIANKELAFQNKEKEKRAAELAVANKILAIENKEKEKKAQELILANNELAHQNREKEKRADELILANKELAFQNKERKKRAAELVLSDKAMTFQSEEKEKQQEANKELETFSYSISHDLRAPLRHITGFIDLLIKNNSSQLDLTGLRYLNIISESALEMGNLIDALLTFSRLSRTELQRTTINSKAMVEQVINTFSDEFTEREIEINTSELPFIRGDELLINQVWINLISNALKYTRKKEKTIIHIGSKIENDFTIFQIQDNGVGFNMKYVDKLFGVFQRLHKASDFEGVGIGLANVNRIIMRHGGKCWAKSEIDNGATFFFSLPNNI